MSDFNLSYADFKYMQKHIYGDDMDLEGKQSGQAGNNAPLGLGLGTHQAEEEQGLIADTIDSVQMGAWQGFSDLSRGLGVLFNSDWLNQAADWAAHQAEANKETMSSKMQEALGQSAFDGWDSETGEGKGVLNAYWWAGNLGSLIGQNIDTVVTLGAGKVATTGVKAAGKFSGKAAGKYINKEIAEKIGQATVKAAERLHIPEKYRNTLGYTAIASAMSAGSRANQVREELDELSNKDFAQNEKFQQMYWDLKDSEQGQGLSDEDAFEQTKAQFYHDAQSNVILNPVAIATDVVANGISGLGGGIWGYPQINKALGKPAQSIKGGVFKGGLVETATEGLQAVGEQVALNNTAKNYYDEDRTLTDGMGENIADSMILGGAFGGAMGGYEAGAHRSQMNRARNRILEAVSTGDERIDAQIRAQVETINNAAHDIDELISPERLSALNQAGLQAAEKNRRRAEIEAELRGEPQTETQTTAETANTPYHQRNLADIQAEFIQNGLDENDFNDFIDANLQQATKDLQHLQTNPFRMGADLQQGLAEKQAYNAKYVWFIQP